MLASPPPRPGTAPHTGSPRPPARRGARDGQPEAAAARALAAGAAAEEAVEDALLLARLQAAPAVGHREQSPARLGAQLHADGSPGRRVLDRVLDEVVEHHGDVLGRNLHLRAAAAI